MNREERRRAQRGRKRTPGFARHDGAIIEVPDACCLIRVQISATGVAVGHEPGCPALDNSDDGRARVLANMAVAGVLLDLGVDSTVVVIL